MLRVGVLQKIRVFKKWPKGQPEGPGGRLVRPEGPTKRASQLALKAREPGPKANQRSQGDSQSTLEAWEGQPEGPEGRLVRPEGQPKRASQLALRAREPG